MDLIGGGTKVKDFYPSCHLLRVLSILRSFLFSRTLSSFFTLCTYSNSLRVRRLIVGGPLHLYPGDRRWTGSFRRVVSRGWENILGTNRSENGNRCGEGCETWVDGRSGQSGNIKMCSRDSKRGGTPNVSRAYRFVILMVYRTKRVLSGLSTDNKTPLTS